MRPPRLERLPPLPLPVALLPPLWPRETTLRGPVGLIVLIAVRIRLGHGENCARENFLQLGGEKGLQAAACLGHLRVRLQSGRRKKKIAIRVISAVVKQWNLQTNRISILNLHNWILRSCGTWDRRQQQTRRVSCNTGCSPCRVWPWSQTGPSASWWSGSSGAPVWEGSGI